MDYNQVANAIVGHCGGLANFLHVTNCMTRVRMTISDQTRVNIAALKSIEGVLGVVEDDTLQIIVGPGKSSKVKAPALHHRDKRFHAAQFIHIANLWLVII